MGVNNDKPATFAATSAADLSAVAYVFVKYSAGSTNAKKVVELCESGVPCGIVIKGEVAGVTMEVIPLNGQPAKITASAAISVGAYVGPTTGGEGIAVTADKGGYFFVADEAATAANDVIVGYTANGYLAA